MRPTLMTSVSRWAHLLGNGPVANAADDKPAEDENQVGKKKGEGDDPVDTEGDDNKEGAKKTGAGDDPDQGDDGVPAEGAAADGEGQGDDAVPPEGGKKKGEGDDDDESEMRGSSPAAKARVRERDRIAAIFACPQAATNLPLACSLAFETRLPRAEAIAVLKKGGVAQGAARGDRAARNPTGMGPDRAPTGGAHRPASAVQSTWDRALAKAGVKTKA